MVAGHRCHASLFLTFLILFFSFFRSFFAMVRGFPWACCAWEGCWAPLSRAAQPGAGGCPWTGQIPAKCSLKKRDWSAGVAQRFGYKQVKMIYGCSGIYHSNAKCCSVLVWLFVMPFGKHKQIDRLAPAAAYDIYTTCMIQHASLGK